MRPPAVSSRRFTGRVAPAIVSSPATVSPSTLVERNAIGELPSTFASMFLRISRRSLSVSGLTPRCPSRTSSEPGSAVSSIEPRSTVASQRVTSMMRSWPTFAATPSR